MDANSVEPTNESTDLPEKQIAVAFEAFGSPLTLRCVPIPKPESDELLIRLEYSGVCHTDIHGWKGEGVFRSFRFNFPSIPGHEGVGAVVGMGSAVCGFEIGDRVGISCVRGICLDCEFCKKGLDVVCRRRETAGCSHNGTFQQFATVRFRSAVRIPKNVSLVEAAPMLCAGVTAYRALREANLRVGDIVAIIGAAGGVGSMALQFARAMGFRPLGIDLAEKEEFCREMGAEWFCDVSGDLTQKIHSICPDGVSAALNFSNSVESTESSFRFVKTKGTVVLVALCPNPIRIDPIPLILKALTIRTSLMGSRADMDEAMGFLERKAIRVPVTVVNFAEIPKVFEDLENGKICGRIVLELWK